VERFSVGVCHHVVVQAKLGLKVKKVKYRKRLENKNCMNKLQHHKHVDRKDKNTHKQDSAH
jgi:hypothetical protein